jgi:uncharacterized protein (TIGR02284 family)
MSAETLDTVNDLLQTLRDGVEGYESAAEGAKDPSLKATLAELASERKLMIAQMVTLASADPDADKSSITSALHRGWIGLKAALTSGDDHAILAECERGEDHALKACKEASAQPLPGDVQSVVAGITVKVQAAHDRIKAMREASK